MAHGDGRLKPVTGVQQAPRWARLLAGLGSSPPCRVPEELFSLPGTCPAIEAPWCGQAACLHPPSPLPCPPCASRAALLPSPAAATRAPVLLPPTKEKSAACQPSQPLRKNPLERLFLHSSLSFPPSPSGNQPDLGAGRICFYGNGDKRCRDGSRRCEQLWSSGCQPPRGFGVRGEHPCAGWGRTPPSPPHPQVGPGDRVPGEGGGDRSGRGAGIRTRWVVVPHPVVPMRAQLPCPCARVPWDGYRCREHRGALP